MKGWACSEWVHDAPANSSILVQQVNDRAGLTGIRLITGEDEPLQRGAHALEPAQSVFNQSELLRGSGASLAAGCFFIQRKQAEDFAERETERLSLADKAKTTQCLLRVGSVAVRRPRRLDEQAAALVVADGFDADSRLLCQRTDGELIFHRDGLDSVP